MFSETIIKKAVEKYNLILYAIVYDYKILYRDKTTNYKMYLVV